MNKTRVAISFVFLIASLVLMVFYSSPVKGLKDSYYMIFVHPPFAWVGYIFFVLAATSGYSYIKKNNTVFALKSYSYMGVGFVFMAYAAFSGMAWGKHVWGDIGITNLDPKFTSIVYVLIIYGAYFIMRNSIENPDSQMRISTLYAMICLPFATFFVFIMPRIEVSLHPENPIFSWKKTDTGSTGFSFGYVNLTTLLTTFIGVLLLALEIQKLKFKLSVIENKIGELYE